MAEVEFWGTEVARLVPIQSLPATLIKETEEGIESNELPLEPSHQVSGTGQTSQVTFGHPTGAYLPWTTPRG